MASQRPQRPAFTDLVIKTIQERYPIDLADNAWDNTGLLLDHVATGSPPTSQTVLLTNDLTSRVADDAIARGASVIVTYHPLIFRGLKSITLADSQQVSILKLARAGIAVYSPHTAIDASPYGLGQWLAKLVAGDDQVTTSVIKPVTSGPKDEKFAGAGYGAVGTLSHPRSLSQVLSRLRAGLAVHQDTTLTGMLVARPRGASDPKDLEDVQIKSFAVCAGSGSSILACAPDVDLWVTGEMSHHEALKAVEEGRVVVTVSHSNSERRFLIDELQPWLQQELRNNNLDHLQKVDVVVSSEDEDPFRVVEVGQTLIERPF